MKVWHHIRKDVRGVTFGDRTKLFLSSAIDPFLALVFPDKINPSAYFDARVVVGESTIHIRGRSDDIWHVAPVQEVAVRKKIRETLSENSTFVDCGANVGGYSIMAARLVGPKGRVVAIEMLEGTVKALRRNLALNGLENVAVIPKALGACSGKTVEATYVPGQYGPATVTATDGNRGRRKSVTVETTTLDEVCANLERIGLMRMDLEGAEHEALLGAAQTLARTDCIIFECWLQCPQKDAIFALLRRFGFSISALDETNYWAYRERL